MPLSDNMSFSFYDINEYNNNNKNLVRVDEWMNLEVKGNEGTIQPEPTAEIMAKYANTKLIIAIIA